MTPADLRPLRPEEFPPFDRLMPDGPARDDHEVGLLPVGRHLRPARALFVTDVEIEPGHRGRGFGRGAMLAAADSADAGCLVIGHDVFGESEVARPRHDRGGYRVVATQLAKELDAPRTGDGEPS